MSITGMTEREFSSGDGTSGARSNQAHADGRSLTTYTVGALPIINQALSRMRLAEFMDGYLPPSDARSKVGTREGLLVLIRSILVSREPVYGLGEWAELHAPDLLGLAPHQVSRLNDDCVGRCLERLFDADYRSMVLALMAHVVKEFDVDLEQLHNDSTSITFFGSYDEATAASTRRGKPTLAITHGHNKDHRPDLKQLLFILTVARDGGVPIYFNAADGNVTDDRTHCETWDLMCEIVGRKDFLYVADSKLATQANMAHIHEGGGRFVSILPRTRTEPKDLRQRTVNGEVAWKDLWTRMAENGDVDDVYRVATAKFTTKEGYRLLWIHSLNKKERDAAKRSRAIEKALGDLGRLEERLSSPRTRFRKRSKVRDAVDKILGDHDCWAWLSVDIEEHRETYLQQESKGRPGKETKYVNKVRKSFGLDYELNEEALLREAKADGTFPLVTNATDLSDRDVLLAYKKQPRVEKRFSQLKSDFEVAPVYLKNVDRVEALLCAYFLAMLTQALIERELRLAMKAANVDSLPLYPEGRDCKRPCTRRILDLYQNIQRHQLEGAAEEVVTMVTDLSSIQNRVLSLLEIPSHLYGRKTPIG